MAVTALGFAGKPHNGVVSFLQLDRLATRQSKTFQSSRPNEVP